VALKTLPSYPLQIVLLRRNDRKLRQRRRGRRRSISYFLTPWWCHCCLANHVTNPVRHPRSLPSRLQLPVKQAVREVRTVFLLSLLATSSFHKNEFHFECLKRLRDLRFRLHSQISFSAVFFNVSGYKIKVLKPP
jgi:hypothetical protein